MDNPIPAPIPAETRLGPVHLTVADLPRLIDYYTRLGLALVSGGPGANSAALGVATEPLLVLHKNSGAQRHSGTAGLYHFAILLPDRKSLSRALRNFAAQGIRVGGMSDHAVSEALYLTDPEGNGIEVYRDRPRSQWQRDNGVLRIVTERLDLDGLLAETTGTEPWHGFPTGTKIGHIHLHVGSIDAAEQFYGDVLGFARVTRYGPSATFLAAGGYHHHIGANTWAGVGAPPAPTDALGLRHWMVVLPDEAALAQVAARLEASSAAVERQEGKIFTRDPSGNRLCLQPQTVAGF